MSPVLGQEKTDDEDSGRELSYSLVARVSADAATGKLSVDSPVGRALVGRDTGDYVVVVTPAGERRYRILGIT